jgi:hypothetical protein
MADLFYAIGGAHDITLSHDYFHDIAGSHLLTRGSRNVTLEHSKLARNRRPDTAGSAAWSASNDDGGIVRFCVFEDDAAAPLFFGNADGEVSEDWQIHGNVFVDTRTFPEVSVYGVVYVAHSAVRWDFHHNTIVGLRGTNAGVIAMGRGSIVRAYNNLWARNEVNAIDLETADHDHNWFGDNVRLDGCSPACDLDATTAEGEPSGQDGSGDPFVGRALGDYSLGAPTAPGRALGAPFDVDMLGRRRGVDGTLDRGAIERP